VKNPDIPKEESDKPEDLYQTFDSRFWVPVLRSPAPLALQGDRINVVCHHLLLIMKPELLYCLITKMTASRI
jgi:hypothetical protein